MHSLGGMFLRLGVAAAWRVLYLLFFIGIGGLLMLALACAKKPGGDPALVPCGDVIEIASGSVVILPVSPSCRLVVRGAK